MSGPRVTSGESSKQDYATPDDFIKAVENRFGPVQFDLAAHSHNKKHPRYFAPPGLNDQHAYAIDAFSNAWAQLSEKFPSPSGTPGLLWLNCEFSDIAPWAHRCVAEAQLGANIALLVPVSMANWFKDYIAGVADTHLLIGRLCFDGRNVYPKDCMLAHFHADAKGSMSLWNWKKDVVSMKTWTLSKRNG